MDEIKVTKVPKREVTEDQPRDGIDKSINLMLVNEWAKKFIKQHKLEKYGVVYYTEDYGLIKTVAKKLNISDEIILPPEDDSVGGIGISDDLVIIIDNRIGGGIFAFIFAKDRNKLKKILTKRYPPGVYKLISDYNGVRVIETQITKERRVVLDNNAEKEISEEIRIFFSKKDVYKKNNIAYKRGVLFYGSPGNGKTSVVKNIVLENPDKFSFIIDCTGGIGENLIRFLKDLPKDKGKIIIFEDIDGLQITGRSGFLNFVDGLDSIENTFIIATTNDIGKVDHALINRPSRFDILYKFENPSEETRRKILKLEFPNTSQEKIDIYAKMCEGFSGAYMKEIFIMMKLREIEIDKAIEHIKVQIKMFKDNSRPMYTG